MPIFDYREATPVQEKYMGGNHSEFKKIEASLSTLIPLLEEEFPPLVKRAEGGNLLRKGKKSVSYFNEHADTKKIEAEFKKFFGLKAVNIIWTSTGSPNAVTPCRSFTFLDKVKDTDGHYKNNKLTVNILIDVHLVTYFELTEKEVLAILLHEIGHSFYNSILQLISRFNVGLISLIRPWDTATIQNIAGGLISLGLVDAFNVPQLMAVGKKNVDAFFEKHLSPVVELGRLVNEYFFNMSAVLGAQNSVVGSIRILKDLPNFIAQNVLTTNAVFGYHTERFSDNFAADHGYGLHLATAMKKLEESKNVIGIASADNIPVLNMVMDLVRVQAQLFVAMVDPHPRYNIRIRAGLDRLKQNSKDPSLPAHIRRDLEKEIALYEDMYDKYLDLDDGVNKKRILSWLIKVSMEKLAGGKLDIRELTWKMDRLSKI